MLYLTSLVPFEKKKLRVPVKAMPWPKDRAKRISVNSFGIGGTNAHVRFLPTCSTTD